MKGGAYSEPPPEHEPNCWLMRSLIVLPEEMSPPRPLAPEAKPVAVVHAVGHRLHRSSVLSYSRSLCSQLPKTRSASAHDHGRSPPYDWKSEEVASTWATQSWLQPILTPPTDAPSMKPTEPGMKQYSQMQPTSWLPSPPRMMQWSRTSPSPYILLELLTDAAGVTQVPRIWPLIARSRPGRRFSANACSSLIGPACSHPVPSSFKLQPYGGGGDGGGGAGGGGPSGTGGGGGDGSGTSGTGGGGGDGSGRGGCGEGGGGGAARSTAGNSSQMEPMKSCEINTANVQRRRMRDHVCAGARWIRERH